MFSSEDLELSFGENTSLCLSGKLQPDPSSTRGTYEPPVQPHSKQGGKALFLRALS